MPSSSSRPPPRLLPRNRTCTSAWAISSGKNGGMTRRSASSAASWSTIRHMRKPTLTSATCYCIATMRTGSRGAWASPRELVNDPSHAQANAYLGDVLLQRDDAEAARPLLEKARRLDPKIRIVHLDLGILHAGRKEYDPAA